MIDTVKNLVVGAIVVWALIYGINVNGKHYGLDFSKNGVTLIWGR